MLLIYTQKESPRFKYIAKQIFERILGISVSITLKIEDFVAYSGPKFSYGAQPLSNELFFQSVGLLFEKGINDGIIKIKDWDGLPYFYATTHSESSLPFDIFAASFYLLTRYEEYLPQVKDKLGRFIAPSSVAHQHDFLKKPVVDLWAKKLKKVLLEKFPDIEYRQKQFSLTLLCEVNEAFAYKKKGWFRTIKVFVKDFSRLKLRHIFTHIKVIFGATKDPYDNYYFLINNARKSRTNIQFFFGLGNYSTHEKSINSNSKSYQKLIKSIADYCPIGLRLSFDAQKDTHLLKIEKNRFEQITHRAAENTFCQYSKINLPNTYRELVEHEVVTDHSMGYMENAGFRAGTCTPFLFYDLDYEIQTPLKIIPFCLTNKAFAKIKTPEIAIKEAEKILNKVKSAQGNAVIHIENNLFQEVSNRAEFWKKMYAYFLNFK